MFVFLENLIRFIIKNQFYSKIIYSEIGDRDAFFIPNEKQPDLFDVEIIKSAH